MRRCPIFLSSTFLFLLLATNSAWGQAPLTAAGQLDLAALKAAGFEPLFNGNDLQGWSSLNGNGQFKVEAGTIVGFGENINANTFLCTQETFKDFELAFEFRFLDRAGNSGLMFRANQRPDKDGKPDPNGRVFGYQCEHDQNHSRSWTAGLYDEARRGWLFPRQGDKDAEQKFTAQGQQLYRWDDWNVITVRCEGNHIESWLNGERRVDFVDQDEKDATYRGFIGLQVHNGPSCRVAWRNIYLKVLHEE
jgi:hypothetical protein